MLRRTVCAVEASSAVDHVLIVTREQDAVRQHLPVSPGVTVLPQGPDWIGLNGALELGRTWAIANGFDAMLVLPGDLPAIDAQEIARLAESSATVTIAPDRHRAGTNALLLRLGPDAGRRFAFAFGDDSYQQHTDEARRLGVRLEHLHLRGVELDLDTPDDWQRLPIAMREHLLAAMEEFPDRSAPSAEQLVALKGD
jgi:2-phospho-L-lactate guanylyltransferase